MTGFPPSQRESRTHILLLFSLLPMKNGTGPTGNTRCQQMGVSPEWRGDYRRQLSRERRESSQPRKEVCEAEPQVGDMRMKVK
jgi:hypothetical protein